MKDRHVREKLSEYIDGILSEEEASSVKAHLDRCPECMEEYEDMVKIIGHMSQVETLETPESLLAKVHERIEKPSFLRRLINGLFVPLKIKLPLELAGVAAAALLVIYIVGIRGKQHVYELAYVHRSRTPVALQERTPEPGTVSEESISAIDETTTLNEKAKPATKRETETLGKRDKRLEAEDAFATGKKDLPALAPTEKRMERRARVEEAVPQSEMIGDEAKRSIEPGEEITDREVPVKAQAPSGIKAEKSGLETAGKDKEDVQKVALAKQTPIDEELKDIIATLDGKIIESECNADTGILESLLIEMAANNIKNLIRILEGRGDIEKPYPTVIEKGRDTVRVRIRLR